MSNLENEIWELVHNWCNEQSCEIPDFNRRVLMERILALRQPPVIGSVCNGCGSKFDAMDISVGVCYYCQKEIKETDL